MQRRRVATAVGLVAVLAVLGVGAIVVVPGSDAATTDLSVAASALPAPPPAVLPTSGTVRWSAPSLPTGGSSVDGGTVIVGLDHRLSGRDALTGAERWSYRRGNATLCGWTVQDGAVIAAFAKQHGCIDLIALNAGTGARRWYRTAPDLGPDATLVGASGVVVARSGDQLLAVDTVTGLNRWTARRPGCQYGPVRLSVLGAAVVLACPGRTLLVDHDAYADTEHWAVDVPGSDPTVVTVGDPTTLLSMLGGRPTLSVYDGRGKVRASITDPRLAWGHDSVPTGFSAAGITLIWTGTTLLGIDTGTRAVRWSTPALGPPVQDGADVLVTQPGGFAQRAVTTGAVHRQLVLPGHPPGPDTVPTRVGALVAASGRDTLTVYG
jgi:outer membrane protein assembly factor BamB